MMWGWHEDDKDDVGMRGTTWVETMETTALGTTWGPSGGYGDNVGIIGMTWGWQR